MNRDAHRLAQQTMAFVLAGGRGSRLFELTDRRAKPAMYFAGKNRIIDFPLSNAVNSGMRRIAVATQYKSHSLIRHLQRGWSFFRAERNESLDILPASQQLNDEKWYKGTADAVLQNDVIIRGYGPKYMIILAGDHIYKQDYALMIAHHVDSGADITVGCIEVPRKDATELGVMRIDDNDRILEFVEKPKDPPSLPNRKNVAMASMGIYVFATDYLLDLLSTLNSEPGYGHDFGGDVVPRVVAQGKAVAHSFRRSCIRSSAERKAYWRDVGTVDAFWQANIDLTDFEPELDLYDQDWPIWTYSELTAPAKFIHDEDGRRGQAVSSMVSGGCVISGSSLQQCLLFTGVKTHSFSHLNGVVALPYAEINRNANLTNTVVDRGVKIPHGLIVGQDPELDARRFRRTANGVCLITQPMIDRLES